MGVSHPPHSRHRLCFFSIGSYSIRPRPLSPGAAQSQSPHVSSIPLHTLVIIANIEWNSTSVRRSIRNKSATRAIPHKDCHVKGSQQGAGAPSPPRGQSLFSPGFACKRRTRSLVLTLAVNVMRESDPTDKGLRCQGRRRVGEV